MTTASDLQSATVRSVVDSSLSSSPATDSSAVNTDAGELIQLDVTTTTTAQNDDEQIVAVTDEQLTDTPETNIGVTQGTGTDISDNTGKQDAPTR